MIILMQTTHGFIYRYFYDTPKPYATVCWPNNVLKKCPISTTVQIIKHEPCMPVLVLYYLLPWLLFAYRSWDLPNVFFFAEKKVPNLRPVK